MTPELALMRRTALVLIVGFGLWLVVAAGLQRGAGPLRMLPEGIAPTMSVETVGDPVPLPGATPA